MKASGFRIFDIRYRVNTFHKLWLLFRTKLDIDPQSYYDKSKAYYDKLVGFLSRPGRKDENRGLPGEPWKSCGFFSRPCKNYSCPENRVPVGVTACKTPWPPCFYSRNVSRAMPGSGLSGTDGAHAIRRKPCLAYRPGQGK